MLYQYILTYNAVAYILVGRRSITLLFISIIISNVQKLAQKHQANVLYVKLCDSDVKVIIG